MPTFDQNQTFPNKYLFGRQRSLHAIFGGGRVADVLLWKKKRLSAAILAGLGGMWYFFEVAEYHFVTLLCHVLILSMLAIFVWHNSSGLISWGEPDVRQFELSEYAIRFVFDNVNWFIVKLFQISSGGNLKTFFMVIACLWVLSAVGTYCSFLNLLVIVFVSLQTLPALYERYEKEVEYMASRGNRDMKKLYTKLDTQLLTKIPRGPPKHTKFT